MLSSANTLEHRLEYEGSFEIGHLLNLSKCGVRQIFQANMLRQEQCGMNVVADTLKQ